MQKKLFSAVIATVFTVALAMVGIASAATTIGNNISTGGTVGVSSSSPAQTLGVQGNSYVSGTALFGGAITATSTIAVQSTAATSTVSTGGLTVGTSQLVIQQNSGRVGVGSTTPMYAFVIQNTATPQAAFAYDGENYYTTSVSSAGRVTFNAQGGSSADFTFSDNVVIATTTTTQFATGYNTTNYLAVQTGANGTTTLDVIGGKFASLIFADSLRVATSSVFALEVKDASDNNFLVVDTSGGKLGVSTSSPAVTLAVQGNSYVSGTGLFGGALTATSTITVQSTSATSTISTGGFTVGSTHLVVQQTSGRVGIGSSTPMSLFVVDAPAGLDAFEVGSSTGSVLKVDKNQRVGIGSSTPSALLSINAPATDNAFAVGSSTSPVFLIDKNKRVGINTSTPGAMLSAGAGNSATTTIDLGKACFRLTTEDNTVIYYWPSINTAMNSRFGWATSTTSCF